MSTKLPSQEFHVQIQDVRRLSEGSLRSTSKVGACLGPTCSPSKIGFKGARGLSRGPVVGLNWILVVFWILPWLRVFDSRRMRVNCRGIILSKTGRNNGHEASITAMLSWLLSELAFSEQYNVLDQDSYIHIHRYHNDIECEHHMPMNV